MKLRDLLDLIEDMDLDPDATVIAVARNELFMQEMEVTADAHLATSEDEDNVLVFYIPEESNV